MTKISIFQPGYYRVIDEEKIERDFRTMGCLPIDLTDSPNFTYHTHTHPTDKIIVVLEGEQDIRVVDKSFHMRPGDRIAVPAREPHSAKIGPQGCRFFWSVKQMPE